MDGYRIYHLNIKTKDHNSSNCIEVDNDIITDNKQICDNLIQYFTTVAFFF